MKHRQDRQAYRTPEDKRNYFAFREEIWKAIDEGREVSIVELARKYKQL